MPEISPGLLLTASNVSMKSLGTDKVSILNINALDTDIYSLI